MMTAMSRVGLSRDSSRTLASVPSRSISMGQKSSSQTMVLPVRWGRSANVRARPSVRWVLDTRTSQAWDRVARTAS